MKLDKSRQWQCKHTHTHSHVSPILPLKIKEWNDAKYQMLSAIAKHKNHLFMSSVIMNVNYDILSLAWSLKQHALSDVTHWLRGWSNSTLVHYPPKIWFSKLLIYCIHINTYNKWLEKVTASCWWVIPYKEVHREQGDTNEMQVVSVQLRQNDDQVLYTPQEDLDLLMTTKTV